MLRHHGKPNLLAVGRAWDKHQEPALPDGVFSRVFAASDLGECRDPGGT